LTKVRRWLALALVVSAGAHSHAQNPTLPPGSRAIAPTIVLEPSPAPTPTPTPSPVTPEQIRSALESAPGDPAKPAAAPGDPKLKATIRQVLEERDAAKKKEEEAKKAAAEAEGHAVGSVLNLQARWSERGLTFTSPDKDFDVHIGGRAMTDGVWFRQSPQLK